MRSLIDRRETSSEGRHYHIARFERRSERVRNIPRVRLFRGFRHDRAGMRASQPSMKLLQPGAFGDIMHRAIGEVRWRARAPGASMRRGRAWSSNASSRRSRQGETGSRRRGRTGTPAPENRRPRPAARRRRQLESLAVPMIDVLRPVRAERLSRRGRTDRVIADLGAALRMRRDPGAELHGEHLGAEANAEERPLLAQAAPRSSRSPGGHNRRGSLALIGPPKITAPACSSSVSGKGSPNAAA